MRCREGARWVDEFENAVSQGVRRSQAPGTMSVVAFSTRPEMQTLAGPQAALSAHGYLVSQKTRVLDVIEAAATNPEATAVRGASIRDQPMPALRAAAGLLNAGHPVTAAGGLGLRVQVALRLRHPRSHRSAPRHSASLRCRVRRAHPSPARPTQENGRNVHALGRSPNHWTSLHDKVGLRYLQHKTLAG